MIDHQPWSLQRRVLLAGLAGLAASTGMGGNQLMVAIEQNTLKRKGIGLRACEPERAFPGFTLFAPHFVQNSNVYLIDLQGEVVHTWNMPYPPGLSGYLTERGTLFYNGRTSEESFLSDFRSKAAWCWKPTGMARSFGRYVTRAIITTGSCSATATCSCIAWPRCPTTSPGVSLEAWWRTTCNRASMLRDHRQTPARCTPIIWPRLLLKGRRSGSGGHGSISIPRRM